MQKVDITTSENGSFLNLPNIPDDNLPTVTIVTPTYNRHDNFEIAIRNYKSYNYPRDKLFWIILDDSPNDSLKSQLPIDKSIKYVHSDIKETIGKKRNRLASLCQTTVICHMDDDDYYYPDSVIIRVVSMMAYKKGVSGCIEYNCYNLVDDTQFLARGKEELMNIGEASLCYLKDYWTDHKYCDEDTHEESIFFLKGNISSYIDVPCIWTLLSITHGFNVSGRRQIAPVLAFSFLEALPVQDFEYIKSLKLKLMMKNPENARCMTIVSDLQKNNNNQEKMIDKLTNNQRKNVIIREFLNTIPTKSSCSENDFLIVCYSGQYCKELKFEEETELIAFIKENKNKYRFTIYVDCEKGYSFEGITLSPSWKWRTCNKYAKCLIYSDPSHLKFNINVKDKYIYNNYSFTVPELSRAKEIKELKELEL